jgi:hypothetical protein
MLQAFVWKKEQLTKLFTMTFAYCSTYVYDPAAYVIAQCSFICISYISGPNLYDEIYHFYLLFGRTFLS